MIKVYWKPFLVVLLNKVISGLQIFFPIGGPNPPWSKEWWVIFLNDGPKHIKLTKVDILEVYLTYTLTQTLVCIHVY